MEAMGPSRYLPVLAYPKARPNTPPMSAMGQSVSSMR